MTKKEIKETLLGIGLVLIAIFLGTLLYYFYTKIITTNPALDLHMVVKNYSLDHLEGYSKDACSNIKPILQKHYLYKGKIPELKESNFSSDQWFDLQFCAKALYAAKTAAKKK